MADDDIDFDLDVELGHESPHKRRTFQRAPRATPIAPTESAGVASGADAAPAATQASIPPQSAPPAAPRKISVVPTKRKGIFARILSRFSEWLGRIQLPRWDLRNFLLGLGVVLLIALVLDNWSLMRLTFFVGHADVPKSLALLVAFLVGVAVAWLAGRRRGAARGLQQEEGG